MSRILTVHDLSVSFDGDVALKNLSIELDSGEALAVIGPNGAGKTVFLRALLNMVPVRGTITWARDARVGYVPQKIDADRHLPINFANLLTAKASLSKQGARSSVYDSVHEVVETVGLTSQILETPVGHLSGGQFQRALIAFALLGNPNVLILDEPTASIDKPGEEKMYELIHRLQERIGITIILVSHDLNFVYRYATKVLCLDRAGVCFGTPDEALTPAILEKLYGSQKPYRHVHRGEKPLNERSRSKQGGAGENHNHHA